MVEAEAAKHTPVSSREVRSRGRKRVSVMFTSLGGLWLTCWPFLSMTPWVDLALPTLNPSPCNSTPDLPDNVWSRILGFATHVHGYNYLEMDDELARLSDEAEVNVTRRNIVLVSKRFYVSSRISCKSLL